MHRLLRKDVALFEFHPLFLVQARLAIWELLRPGEHNDVLSRDIHDLQKQAHRILTEQIAKLQS